MRRYAYLILALLLLVGVVAGSCYVRNIEKKLKEENARALAAEGNIVGMESSLKEREAALSTMKEELEAAKAKGEKVVEVIKWKTKEVVISGGTAQPKPDPNTGELIDVNCDDCMCPDVKFTASASHFTTKNPQGNFVLHLKVKVNKISPLPEEELDVTPDQPDVEYSIPPAKIIQIFPPKNRLTAGYFPGNNYKVEYTRRLWRLAVGGEYIQLDGEKQVLAVAGIEW